MNHRSFIPGKKELRIEVIYHGFARRRAVVDQHGRLVYTTAVDFAISLCATYLLRLLELSRAASSQRGRV
jgi:hypothetical protein